MQSLYHSHRSGKYHMNMKCCISCIQPTIIWGDLVQKVDVFANLKTTLQISVYLKYITSGLKEEKKSHGLQCSMQNGMLQSNQCWNLYVFSMNMERHVMYPLLTKSSAAQHFGMGTASPRCQSRVQVVSQLKCTIHVSKNWPYSAKWHMSQLVRVSR